MGAWRLERAAATAKVTKAEAEFRKKQRAVCCSDRAGGAGKDGNPLKRDRMPVGVDSIIDSMASSAPAAVKEVLCAHSMMYIHRARRMRPFDKSDPKLQAGGRHSLQR